MLLEDLLKFSKLNRKRRKRVSLNRALYIKHIVNISKIKDDRTRNASNISYTLYYVILIIRRVSIIVIFNIRGAYNSRILIIMLLIKDY